jgi:NADH:ubiquinone oxidoreductase subunit C
MYGYCSIIIQNNQYIQIILNMERNIKNVYLFIKTNEEEEGPIILHLDPYVSKIHHLSELIGPLHKKSIYHFIHYLQNQRIFLKIESSKDAISIPFFLI